MNNDEVIRTLAPLVEAFEKLQIMYYIGGSVASSIYGEPRRTQDADVVADIQPRHVPSLVRLLEAEYYIDADAIQGAIRHRSSFNIIYLDSMFKVDIFIPKARPFAQQERLRAQKHVIEDGTPPMYLSSPEDIILNKLEWYQMGGEVSTRQWNDVFSVLRMQAMSLDFPYLRSWAHNLNLADLLERAIGETGLSTE